MSTSIVIHRDDGRVGRLNMFDETDGISMSEIQNIADRWRGFYGPAVKIEVVKTNDKKCRPNFSV